MRISFKISPTTKFFSEGGKKWGQGISQATERKGRGGGFLLNFHFPLKEGILFEILKEMRAKLNLVISTLFMLFFMPRIFRIVRNIWRFTNNIIESTFR